MYTLCNEFAIPESRVGRKDYLMHLRHQCWHAPPPFQLSQYLADFAYTVVHVSSVSGQLTRMVQTLCIAVQYPAQYVVEKLV
jgi:hypothetical protein